MPCVRILNHGVSVETDAGGKRVTLDDDDGWLVVALALAPPQGLSARAIRQVLGIGTAAGPLRKRLARLRAETGLPIRSSQAEAGATYRLDRDGVTVDALRYLDLADAIRSNPAGDNRAALYEADAIWESGPPELGGRAGPAPEMYERLHRAHTYLQSLRKRILIVDDQVGDILAERLSRHDCRVAHDLKEFNTCRNELHRFDLAVVDLHLTTSYADATGDVIVRDINAQGLALPVIMITLRPPMNRSVPEWIKSLGLVDVVFKETDEPGANMAFVAERVNALLLEDPVERACEQIAHRVYSLRRKAARRIASKLAGIARDEAVKSMEADADKVALLAGESKLSEARLEVGRFVANWGE